MFANSTQHRNWMFKDEQEPRNQRNKANQEFIEEHGRHMSTAEREKHFLSPKEEASLLRHYEGQLRDFCKRFSPPMPNSVMGTSFHYFKRFYLLNSTMDYHPKEILVTCVYLACKVEEFNVSISQFVGNIRGDREKATDIILNNELLLMQQLDYNLTVHNPFRPVEGLLIDIKTRCTTMANPEQMRSGIEEFLERTFFTDACLIYAPSQIALAAILHSASRLKENLDTYVTGTLFGQHGEKHLSNIVEAVRKIRSMVKASENVPSRDYSKQLTWKLEKCRNQENNPDSSAYKRKMQEILDDDEEHTSQKFARVAEKQRKTEEKLLSMTHSDSSNSP